MAQAAVQHSEVQRFFCHQCSVEIPRLSPDHTCPTCSSGFIEKLEPPADRSDDDMDMDDSNLEELNRSLGEEIGEVIRAVGRYEDAHRLPPPRGHRAVLPHPRLTRIGGVWRTIGTTNRPAGRTGPPPADRTGPPPVANIQSLIEDFLVELRGGRDLDDDEDEDDVGMILRMGVGNGMPQAPEFPFGNPGDWAVDNTGFEAIVENLMNTPQNYGPPARGINSISRIPVVVITQEQAELSIQCSVCQEEFGQGESVRRLPCEHFYHEYCITPWLQAHTTCPVCRTDLG